jgi:hypothetical protein
MIARALSLALFAILAACASDSRNDSARAWQVAECNRVIDKEDRDRCLRRADEDYGRRTREAEPRKK